VSALRRFQLQIAIDGPAGSGKSSVAKKLAARLGRPHIDTGAMYRAVTLCALRENISLDDAAALAARLHAARLEFRDSRLHLDGEDVSSLIRRVDVTAAVSTVAAHAKLRELMASLQRRLASASQEGCVLEGRDIGSAILPLSANKFYLDAAPIERARRRALQMGQRLSGGELERLEREIRGRDEDDTRRAASPLQIAPDAHVIDTTHLSEDEVVERCAASCSSGALEPVDDADLVACGYHNQLYRLARTMIMSPFYRGLLGMRVFGREHERIGGGLIYACNHISNFDPTAVGSAVGRELHFLAKRELFFWPLGPVIRRVNAIPIDRGRWDGEAFDRAEAVLRQGRNLIIFPEGTRRPVGRPGPIKKGLGILAVRSERPYLPVLLRGTTQLGRALFRRGHLQAWIGPPIELRAIEALRRTSSEAAIHAKIGELYLNQLRALEELAREES